MNTPQPNPRPTQGKPHPSTEPRAWPEQNGKPASASASSSPAGGADSNGAQPRTGRPARARPINGSPARRRTEPLASAQLFRSNDRIHLVGGLNDFNERTLHVNGVTLTRLDRRKFLVLLVLFCHSLARSGACVPVQVETTPYLPAQAVLDAIEAHLSGLMPRPGIFLKSEAQDVTDLVYELRLLLEGAHIYRNLIENGPSRYGYRLATPPHQVRLTLHDATGRVALSLRGKKMRY